MTSLKKLIVAAAGAIFVLALSGAAHANGNPSAAASNQPTVQLADQDTAAQAPGMSIQMLLADEAATCRYHCEKEENHCIQACGTLNNNPQWAECRAGCRDTASYCRRACN